MLINDIDKTPHAVLLLDEIEKAHPDVNNIFLQVMDNGILTSSTGKSVTFTNVVLIMTSNAGAAELDKNTLGFGRIEGQIGADDKIINQMFPPEFRNRLDEIVKFNKLTPDNMIRVVDKFLQQLNKMAEAKNVYLDTTIEAKEWLAAKGFDPKFGARPLSRVIDKNIKQPLSRQLLFGDLKNGGVARIVVENDAIKISCLPRNIETVEIVESSEELVLEEI